MTARRVNLRGLLCRWCGAFIRSVHRHDMVGCRCDIESRRIWVDGGSDYTKVSAGPDAMWSYGKLVVQRKIHHGS